MHHQHVELGAVMEESDGWQRPVQYVSTEQELAQVRKTVGLCDISAVGKVSFQGEELDSVLASGLRDRGALDIGAVRRHYIDKGPAAPCDIVLARLALDEVLILTEPNLAPPVCEALDQQADQCAHVVDVTSGLAGVRITGPSGHLLMASVTELDTSSEGFPNMSCAQTKVAEVHAVLLRLDLGSLPSYELYFGRELGEYLWHALFEAGDEYGVVPVGIEAMARLEE
jgi:heterotetrameric sarcosine oxidase gamma subunit